VIKVKKSKIGSQKELGIRNFIQSGIRSRNLELGMPRRIIIPLS
jgi:hypothetical protein